ncbi:PREDICTED: C-C motif chemokine 5-like [Chlamydotis macqueenii]|uniref:C-C motif chemokine 5-like n=1 Tax=Chlamydotis macqueenii TaxID=187382 RepID=UPI000529C273|nr:PREDICTED: C-C motif chemokine 5-like [Chlamydotis macqueenii]
MLSTRTILLLALLLSFSLHRAAAYSTPTECCYGYAQRPIRHVQSFYETSSSCPMPAVVLVTAGGAEICADAKKSWVKKHMKNLQRKK